jgi:hypothetical protein
MFDVVPLEFEGVVPFVFNKDSFELVLVLLGFKIIIFEVVLLEFVLFVTVPFGFPV